MLTLPLYLRSKIFLLLPVTGVEEGSQLGHGEVAFTTESRTLIEIYLTNYSTTLSKDLQQIKRNNQSLIGTVVAEFTLGASEKASGLGFIVLSAKNQSRYDISFAAVFVLVLIGIGLYGIVSLLEQIALHYRRR